MKKITLLVIFALAFMSAECLAGVTFIVDSPQHASRNSGGSSHYTPGYTPPVTPPVQTNETICRSKGYNRNSCPSGQYGVLTCPEDSSYYKYCCPNENRYTFEECQQQGMGVAGAGCHGLYACQPAQ